MGAIFRTGDVGRPRGLSDDEKTLLASFVQAVLDEKGMDRTALAKKLPASWRGSAPRNATIVWSSRSQSALQTLNRVFAASDHLSRSLAFALAVAIRESVRLQAGGTAWRAWHDLAGLFPRAPGMLRLKVPAAHIPAECVDGMAQLLSEDLERAGIARNQKQRTRLRAIIAASLKRHRRNLEASYRAIWPSTETVLRELLEEPGD